MGQNENPEIILLETILKPRILQETSSTQRSQLLSREVLKKVEQRGGGQVSFSFMKNCRSLGFEPGGRLV